MGNSYYSLNCHKEVAFTFGKGRQYMIYLILSFHGKELLCSKVFGTFHWLLLIK